MFVKIDNTQLQDIYMVTDELGKYLGKIRHDDFIELLTTENEFEQKGDIYFFVEKEKLKVKLIK